MILGCVASSHLYTGVHWYAVPNLTQQSEKRKRYVRSSGCCFDLAGGDRLRSARRAAKLQLERRRFDEPIRNGRSDAGGDRGEKHVEEEAGPSRQHKTLGVEPADERLV